MAHSLTITLDNQAEADLKEHVGKEKNLVTPAVLDENGIITTPDVPRIATTNEIDTWIKNIVSEQITIHNNAAYWKAQVKTTPGVS